MELAGSVCVITGSSSGLGRATAEYFVDAGAQVVGLDLAMPADPTGERFRTIVVDITDEPAVAAAMDEIGSEFGGIHAVVNCAGMIRGAAFLDDAGEIFPVELFRRTVDVNLTGTYLVAAHGARWMAKNPPNADGERGAIVNTASIAALDSSSSVAYAASKGAVVSFGLTAARQLAGHGIRVNTIAPGFMDTEMFAGLPPERVDELSSLTVFPRRLGQPNEFARLAKELVENPYLNAALIRVDAGSRV
ncbi:SDR family NAD(P)-dependent oxidoreductase [Agromyces aerolatus]|uniref:SDR family NAD(P)-dependent oxidoreductase n=1 Tax=Agromyces sp. LY-1074 TaxID=3074080 RepID=UPI0028570BE2|nr:MULTISPECIES: SDR family NAD(P)-dependent oxidoreductase [unclassified Agromyces]MDR5699772.1 SDR family oxidoreductase [Agromyces sp. LY-1074]MDR5706068.1 SDR family oxidoreductase [Agromyces sp. LY-1358]